MKNTYRNLYFHIHTRQRYPLTVCVKHAVKHYEQQRQQTTSTMAGFVHRTVNSTDRKSSLPQ